MSLIKLADDLIINTEQQFVTKNGSKLNIPHLTYLLLVSLVKHAPNIVTREVLEAEVWNGRPVSDDTIKQRVSRLRAAIGENSDTPKYFVSVHGQGYRIIAPVKSITKTKNKIAVPFKRKTWIAIVTLIALLFFYFIYRSNDNHQIDQGYLAEDYIKQAISYYVRYQPNDNRVALTLFEQALTLKPDSSFAYAGLAKVYAQGYLQFGENYDWAIKSLDMAQRAITLDNNNPGAYQAKGLAYLATGKLDKAIVENKKAFDLNPSWAAPISNNSEIFQITGKLVQAYSANQTAINLNKKDPIPYAHLANTYRDLGMYEEALEAYNHSLKLKPDYLYTLNALTEFQFITGEFKAAKELISQILSYDVNNANANKLLGLVHLYENNLEESKQAFSKASKMSGLISPLEAQVRLSIMANDTKALTQLKKSITQSIERQEQWPTYYYLLSLLTSKQDVELSIEYLEKAVSAGFSHIYLIESDPMIDSIRQHPKFNSIKQLLSSKLTKMNLEVKQLELQKN